MAKKNRPSAIAQFATRSLACGLLTVSLLAKAQDDPFAELDAEINKDSPAPAAAPSTTKQQAADAFSEMDSEFSEFTEAGQAEDEAEFQAWAKAQEEEFQAWKKRYLEEMENYKKNILKYWDTAEVTDKQTYVQYSDDMTTKRVVDYEKNEIRISIQTADKSAEEIDQLVEKQVEEIIDTTPNEARAEDPVLAAVEADTAAKDEVSKSSVVSELVPEIKSAPPEQLEEIKVKVAKKLVAEAEVKPVVKQKSAATKEVHEYVIKLPESSILQRAQKYTPFVAAFSKETEIEPALIYAIMQTESSFNPMARSPIPAFGLMQIVPGSAGIDVAQKIYGERRTFSPDYLYDAQNNIQAGSTYLSILYYQYLKKIENPDSRWYCTISAYNTGAGNVARAFTGDTNLNKALPTINSMTPDEVYKLLIEKLPHDETKLYLEKVVSRRDSFRHAQI